MRKDEMLKNNEFGRFLASLHVKKGWKQEDAAAHLGFSRHTYSDWVLGKNLPSQEQLKHIAATFKLSQAEEDEFYRAAAQVAPQIHNPPFSPNSFFTGREAELNQLGQALKENGSVALTQPVILSGLGGIGKTQIALAYAYKSFPHVYRAILWVNAASEATLQSGYNDLAQRLDLPEKQEHDAKLRIQAVKDWFAAHTNWLLIMDNADDLSLARSFFPACKHGHILLTTRSQFASEIGAKRLDIDKMTPADGLLFLLRRAGREDDTASETAKQLVELLDGHPLALDQAGAYIQERGTSFAAYIERYQRERQSLLERRRAVKSEHGDHPDSVVVTFRLSFEKAAEQHPLATDILRFCAFLQPDAIPEKLFQYDDQFKADMLTFDEGIIALQRYSLIKSNMEDKVFSIHRLVQMVLIDRMSADLQKQWRDRVRDAMNASFPSTFDDWRLCDRLVPHIMLGFVWSEEQNSITGILATTTDATLYHKAGTFVLLRGQFQLAEFFLNLSLLVYKFRLGAEHPEVASVLANLATLYIVQDRDEVAEPLLHQALAIQEKRLGVDHHDTVSTLSKLAMVYVRQEELEKAEPLILRALSARQKESGAEYNDSAYELFTYAVLYIQQGKYGQAKLLLQLISNIAMKSQEDKPGDVYAASLAACGGAMLLQAQGNHRQAAELSQQADRLAELILGPDHPMVLRLKSVHAAFMRSAESDTPEAELPG